MRGKGIKSIPSFFPTNECVAAKRLKRVDCYTNLAQLIILKTITCTEMKLLPAFSLLNSEQNDVLLWYLGLIFVILATQEGRHSHRKKNKMCNWRTVAIALIDIGSDPRIWCTLTC